MIFGDGTVRYERGFVHPIIISTGDMEWRISYQMAEKLKQQLQAAINYADEIHATAVKGTP